MAEIRKACNDTAEAIKNDFNTSQQHIRELKAIGRPVQFWNDWLVDEIVSRLAFETRKQWELSLLNDDNDKLFGNKMPLAVYASHADCINCSTHQIGQVAVGVRRGTPKYALQIDKKLALNKDFRSRYNEFKDELIEMNHMEPASEVTSAAYYMPHHPVIKESSITIKLRVISMLSPESF
ncbi:unnamed protein product [Ceratitis capitata]|uniref:(Mediterranean fruit fly) hypothetical protein n=1 Tax=Ceratitis capitata TaxID=7213 RepID=A0A811USK0_CERCA|nr:unnamed protein product [Ceratitis capitata]